MDENILCQKKIDFGKINYNGTGKRYSADIDIELRKCKGEKTPEYIELSVCGKIWNTTHTDIVCGGQCLDTMNKFLYNNPVFKKIYRWWKKYHLKAIPEKDLQEIKNFVLED